MTRYALKSAHGTEGRDLHPDGLDHRLTFQISGAAQPSASRDMVPPTPVSAPQAQPAHSNIMFAPPVSPTAAQEVTFINGLNTNGTISDQSYWGAVGIMAKGARCMLPEQYARRRHRYAKWDRGAVRLLNHPAP